MFALPSGVVNLITGAGGALIILLILGYLWVTDRIHTDKAMQREIAHGAAWQKLYQDEVKAHQLDREALVIANDRAEAAVENARVTKMLLEEMRARWELPRRGHAVEQE